MPAQAYELRPRKDKRGVDLISDVLPFGHLWHGENVSRRPTCWIFSRPLTDFPDLPVPRVGRLEDRSFPVPQICFWMPAITYRLLLGHFLDTFSVQTSVLLFRTALTESDIFHRWLSL